MDNAISELNESEINEVSGGGIMYVIGYVVGYASVSAGTFYSELPAGAALL